MGMTVLKSIENPLRGKRYEETSEQHKLGVWNEDTWELRFI